MMTQPAVILLNGHGLPRTYMVLAIIATFICLPLGIPALIYSAKTSLANELNKTEHAQLFSRKSLRFIKFSFFLFILFSLLIAYNIHAHNVVVKEDLVSGFSCLKNKTHFGKTKSARLVLDKLIDNLNKSFGI